MNAPAVVVLDYGSGNLRSAQRALARAGASVIVSADPATALAADGLVIPGVGSFAACMAGIEAVGARTVIEQRVADRRAVLGVCVGMQVLFDQGVEHGVQTAGMGLLPGAVTRLRATRVPHMGWNTVTAPPESQLFAGVGTERFYFVHSYAAGSSEGAVTTAEHGGRFVAAVERAGLAATQFHPEKSGDAGARLLANWVGTL
ncbi:MAG: imidazole glycerol phosphate synthase subunit HisH [Pseudonocardiales bacterium]